MVEHRDVFIVGAGPSGLTLANLLAHYGVSFRIIDKYPSPLVLSKAAAIHARALEALDAVGLAERMLAEAISVNTLMLRTLHKDSVRLDFAQLEHTRYPYITMIPQFRTEALLTERLAEQNIQIERPLLLSNFTQTDEGVAIALQHEDGSIENASATYLVGADGASSSVRHLLGFDFVGDDYVNPWILFDAQLEWDVPRTQMTFSSSPDGIYGVFPLPGENNYRAAYTQNHDAQGNPIEPTPEEAQQMMKVAGIEGKILNITSKFWIFNLQHRQVDDYRHGNVLLLGDAAHIHTPFGGQGLNLGVVDAFNLGWKLAMLVKAQASDSLLDSYQEERHPIGQQVVNSTHIGASAMLLRKQGIKRVLREIVMPVLNNLAPAKKRMVHMMGQLAHHYQGTSLVSGTDGKLSGGQRLPNYPYLVLTGKTDLYTQLDTRRHTLFLVGNDSEKLAQIARSVQASYPDLIAARIISTKSNKASDIAIIVDMSKLLPLKYNTGYLIRPDQMIGKIAPVDEIMQNIESLLPYHL